MREKRIRHPRLTPLGLLSAALLLALAAGSAVPQTPKQTLDTLSGTRMLVIAHRGGAREATENTLFAFQRAIRLGADGIESDLRLTRDGVVVLYHDERYGRVEGLPESQRLRAVSDMTFAELTAQPLAAVGDAPRDARVPRLEDLLRQLPGGLLNLELKRGARFDELVDRTVAILKNSPALERVVLEPPDLKTAEKLRKELGPRLKIHINPGLTREEPLARRLEPVFAFRPHSISVSYRQISWELVDMAHRAGVQVWAWTVDDPAIVEMLRVLGVDAVKTDRPTMALDLLRRNNRRP